MKHKLRIRNTKHNMREAHIVLIRTSESLILF